MNKKKWLGSMNLADDKYVREADPQAVRAPRRGVWVAVGLAAACVTAIIAVGGIALFKPYKTTPPDVSRYADSEYYPIIEQLNVMTYEKPEYKNNFEKIRDNVHDALDSVFNGAIYKGDMETADADGSGIMSSDAPMASEVFGGNGSYVEVTDNQVAGVTEADRIKRSDKYIFYMDGKVLKAYSIAGEDSELVGSYDLYNQANRFFTNEWEFYLSGDCRTVTVITQSYSKDERKQVKIVALDVSDPADIKEKSTVAISGSYISSRMTGGNLLLLTEYAIERGGLDFDDEKTFLPQIDMGNGEVSIPCRDIVMPEDKNDLRYTVVMKLDENTLEPKGTAAYFSYSENAYVSEDKVYLTHRYWDRKQQNDGSVKDGYYTEIAGLLYGGDSFENVGTVKVRGYVKDQYSLDEYQGMLRVVTTTEENVYRLRSGAEVDVDELDNGMYLDNPYEHIQVTVSTNASLYCIDLDTWDIVAEVKDFAPDGEKVRSVRFDGTAAYVCTSIEIKDPVFFFDLSDYDNITYKDTGTIDGFSTSLVDFGDGALLGIGKEGWGDFKTEIYEETSDGVRSVSSYVIYNAVCSEDYKSYYIDRANRIIGLGLNCWGDEASDEETGEYNENRYIVLLYDGYELIPVVNISLGGEPWEKRGVYIDGYMYMFGKENFAVEKIL